VDTPPTAVITGGNSGIGLEAAVGIARHGHKVVIAVRNATKGAAAVADIRQRSGNDRVEQMSLDLASLTSVRKFAEAWNSRNEPIHVLLNNAGLMMRERNVTADGFEMTFGVNHLGHFLLTALLQDALTAAGNARVINVASGAHEFARHGLDFDDLMWERRKYSGMGMGAYAASKLANVMFTRELAKRMKDSSSSGTTANSLHPGFVGSNFARDGDTGRLGEIAMMLAKPIALSPEKGARTSIHLATSSQVAGVSGEYFYKCKPARVSKWAADDAACARLWDISESLVGLHA
jgi:NAD(P)-dependent dehydrogenase (short-subunit alcohol dehydrogenase family)